MLKTSVKQLEMVSQCPRKWAYQYLFGVRHSENPEGILFHNQMSALIKREPPPEKPESRIGKMARALFQQYVHNRSGRHVSELHENIWLPEYDMQVQLRCDYLDRPIFHDWKTTGAERPTSKLPNGKAWALNDLTNDFQANIYAFLLMRAHWAGMQQVQAKWCFVSKKFDEGKEPRVWHVDHTFTWEACKTWFETYVLPARDLILELRAEHYAQRLDSGRLVPHNPASCEYAAKFCDAGGLCRMVPSPVMSFDELRLPVFQERK